MSWTNPSWTSSVTGTGMIRGNREKIRIGVSSCLLGEKVRYDGNHKLNRLITEVLSEHFEFIPFCPEVAIGLGVPRPVIRLQMMSRRPRAVLQNGDNRDITGELAQLGHQVAGKYTELGGYILKSNSPSCGMERVKIHDDNGISAATGSGIYAGALMSALPLLPVEEEGRLGDPDLRENFLERVFIYSHWQSMERAGMTAADLIRFHSQYKFIVMTRDQNLMRELGRLVAKGNPEKTGTRYITLLMSTLKKPAGHGNQVNVLQHIAGFFKKRLDREERGELLQAIESYRKKQVSIIVPLTLIKHHLGRNPDPFLENQAYLD